MDDTCAVCADSLEWVAYGSCGHKDVCSTCVARLRFICSDRRCCICKSESSIIFVTKALGDYTKTISDFSVFPLENKEGRSGSYWYHEDTQSYFDDFEQYKMIKAMCRLSCSVCDKMEDNSSNKSKRKARFRDIFQLKGHLFHQHSLFMCSLCLEGRKVFICEQKLYSKAQLKQHINTGDSEVDGTESERGGFQGHPLCEFCRSPFYGDNELYTHMNTEHFKCHICQRQNPGKYEYYKNYDDLEIHFRQEHFLCEDEACLIKKFIVFPSEAEMKRHNAQEHGGRMSRSKRNAALQLPTSFTYRRHNEQDNRHGRRNTFQRDISESELSRAIEASLQTSSSNSRVPEPSSSTGTEHANNSNDVDPLIQPFESLATDSDPPSRYLMAVSHRPRNTPLQESAFPPLSTAPAASSQVPNGPPKNTMAEKLRRQNQGKVNVVNTGHAWPAPSSSSASRTVNTANTASMPVSGQWKSTYNPVLAPPSTRITHSTSAPNLIDTGSVSDFPPVSTLHTRNVPENGPPTKSVEEVYAANKSMVEKIRAGLGDDHKKYSNFKEVSAQYRQGGIDAETYLVYVDQFGLSHLVLDLARLLPDPHKERELIAVYNANRAMSGGSKGNDRKNKGKLVVNSNNNSTNKLADSILSSVRELQSNYRVQDEEVETLSKDGYRVAGKGKSKVEIDDRTSPGGVLVIKPPKNDSGSGGGDGEGKSKQKKKTSKFLRARLGNGSLASLDLNGGSDATEAEGGSDGNSNNESNDGVPVRGVWRNGGGHRLIGKDPKRP
ncbi:putative transcription factor interactor and regulator LIM family [Helianthus annuus]|nr:putative transcription factor interactor and regulator LIM family [Helianthus annuus]